MTNLIQPVLHGLIDLLAIAGLFLAPNMLGFDGTQAASISYTIGTIHLLMVLLTAYPMGIIKAVPFTVHGWIEFAAAFVIGLMPWMAGFAEDPAARNFYVVAGAALFAVWVFSDYKAESPVRSWAVHHGLAKG